MNTRQALAVIWVILHDWEDRIDEAEGRFGTADTARQVADVKDDMKHAMAVLHEELGVPHEDI